MRLIADLGYTPPRLDRAGLAEVMEQVRTAPTPAEARRLLRDAAERMDTPHRKREEGGTRKRLSEQRPVVVADRYKEE